MSVSTNGQICYGVVFEEDYEFPWDGDDHEGDIEQWWTFDVLGFKHSFHIFDESGDYIGGAKPPQDQIDRYYAERREFEKSHPSVPVEIVNYCSGQYPMVILAVPSSCKTARRGYPEEFDPTLLVVAEEEKAALLDFIKEHNLSPESGPKWWLSSYWG